MILLVTILKDYRHVEALLLGFVELEVHGSTVMEASGMGNVLGNLPIMSSVRQIFPNSSAPSQVVLTVTSELKAKQCLDFAHKQFGLDQHEGTGIMFTVPIGKAIGLTQPFHSRDKVHEDGKEKFLV